MDEKQDFNKVWEIKAIKRRPNYEEALKFLDRVAKQVQPIMRKHNWSVELLSEFCNQRWLGLNIDGRFVKLRLRDLDKEEEFLPYGEVLDTMLHELCHHVYGPHNASFYKLWCELREECADLINRGITGPVVNGFDLPRIRKPLGSITYDSSLSSLESALAAAENKTKKIGGDTSVTAALSPTQAAAMAAKTRLRDKIRCIRISEFCDLSREDEFNDDECCKVISRSAFDERGKMVNSGKRNRDYGQESTAFVDLDTDFSDYRSDYFYVTEMPTVNYYHKLGEASTFKPISSQSWEWQCLTCTLLNPPLAPICDLCGAQKPKGEKLKSAIWSCKVCTLENDVKMDKCVACGAWSYS